MGAQQDSSNTPTGHRSFRSWSVRSIVSLVFVIFVLLSFTLESMKIQSGAWTPQGNDIPAVRSRLR